MTVQGRLVRTVGSELVDASRVAKPFTRRECLVTLAALLALLGLGVLDLVQHYESSTPAAIAWSLLRVAGLLVMLRRPIVGWWIVLLSAVVIAIATRPIDAHESWPWSIVTVLTVAAALALLTPTVHRVTVLIVWLLFQVVGMVLPLCIAVPQQSVLTSSLGALAFTAIAVVAADARATRDRARRGLLAARREASDERSRRALLEERARIARDLHDVVAHHMSVITVQADSAPHRLADLSPAAAEEMASIASSSRAALTEMRSLLDALRTEPSSTSHEPNAGLSGLDALVETVERVGSSVSLSVDPAVRHAQLPAAVELAAYRLVQESLSNVVRHSPGADATVAVSLAGALLQLIVDNGPGGVGGSSSEGSGRGLAGMRERVAALDGSLTAGPNAEGGFRVAATLPVTG